MKKTIIIIAAVLAVSPAFAARKPQKQVVFASSIHCAACARKVQENIAFEKGVKDLKVSVEQKTISVSFDPAKTDTSRLSAAVRKLGYKTRVIEYKDL